MIKIRRVKISTFKKAQVAHIASKMREGYLRWLDHVMHRVLDVPIFRCESCVRRC